MAAARELHAEGLVQGTAGNVSALDAEGRILITPTAVPYEAIRPQDVSVVNGESLEPTSGLKPSSELPMHAAVYKARRDVRAIVHTHSVAATTLAICGQPLPPVHYLMAMIGRRVPVAPYALYGTEQLGALAATALGTEGAILLQNHGVLAVGATLQQAVQRAHLVEVIATLYLKARAAGLTPIELGSDEIGCLARKMKSYGQ